MPEVGDDGRSITLTYSKPFADWEIAFGGLNDGGIGLPAHVLAEKAGLADEQALVDLIQGLKRGNPDDPAKENKDLKAVADFWNTGFDTKSLPTDESLYLSSGPFVVDSITPDQSIALVRNESYTFGPQPSVDEVTIRFIGAAPDQVSALKNGEVDIIAPQPSADTVELLQGIAGVTVDVEDQLAYDHIDLNYKGVFKEASVREAFMKAIPRQAIVDQHREAAQGGRRTAGLAVLRPGPGRLRGLRSQQRLRGTTQEADIEGAKKLLAGATPEVRIMYNKDNPNRADAYALIQESAEKAGFKIVDGGLGASDWGAALGNGTYDATIFGWTSPGVGVSGVPQIFKTGRLQLQLVLEPAADKLMDELIVTTDAAEQDGSLRRSTSMIWDSFYGLPLFQSVGVDAYTATASRA